MNSFLALIAPLALLLPAVAGGPSAPPAGEGVELTVDSYVLPPALIGEFSEQEPWQTLFEKQGPQPHGQVRIEQRIILRISPRPPSGRQDMIAQFPGGEAPMRIEERKMGSCLPIQGIAGVQTGQNNRLILYMRDRRVVSASLEKSCLARDFYSGFYVERSGDGNLCVKRDKIQSRAGAKCELSQLRQLVAVKD